MNPLTQIKNTQKVTKQEIASGVTDAGSWHARFKHSAYIFAGGLAYQLTEGDLLAVFSQYGEVVDVNLVKDRDTGKSRGFAFMAYEDQRSTVLAVDNLSGARVAGRTIRVDHVDNYKIKRAEVEGREVSGSEEDDEDGEEDDHGAQDAAVLAAQLDGATVEHMGSNRAAGAPEQDPWASKTSVLAALQEAGPMRARRPHAEHYAEDPMRGMNLGDDDADPLLSMGAERKAKKAKKEKKEKKDKDKEKKKKQKAKKDQDVADNGGLNLPAAAAERDNRGAMALPADLNGPSHGNGLRNSGVAGVHRHDRGDREHAPRDDRSRDGRDRHELEDRDPPRDNRDPPKDNRNHVGRSRLEQDHRRHQERYDDRHREQRYSREHDHGDGHRERDHDRARHR